MEFKPYFEDYSNQKNTEYPINDYLIKFANDKQPGLLKTLNAEESERYLLVLQQVVFCHRSKKNDKFTQNLLLDYDLIRNTLYKYSKKCS